MTRAMCQSVAIVLLITPIGGCTGFRPLPMGAAAPGRTAPGWRLVAGQPAARALPRAAPGGEAQPIGPARAPFLRGAASASSLHIGDTVRLALRHGPTVTMTVQAIVPEGLVGTRGEYAPWGAIVSVTVLTSDTYRRRLLTYGAIIAIQALVYGIHGG